MIRSTVTALLVGALLMALGACSDVDVTSLPTTTPPLPEGPGVAGVDPGGTIDLSVPLVLEPLDSGHEELVAVASLPGSSSVVVAERAGSVDHVLVGADGTVEAVRQLIDLSEAVETSHQEQGLLGVAVSPERDLLVVSYTEAGSGDSVVERVGLSGPPDAVRVVADSRAELLRVQQPHANHNGGHVAFGPDGMLYVGLGDGGLGGDPTGRAQSRRELLGSILRIAPDGTIPADNPWSGATDGSRAEIWLTGVRNPWRFSFDPLTGDLWVADVGEAAEEEITLLPAAEGAGRGANLGWDLWEGRQPFGNPDPGPDGASDGPFVAPIHSYGREGGCAVTGGLVVRGGPIPELDGVYLFGDFCATTLRALVAADGAVQQVELPDLAVTSVSAMAATDAGEVYVASLSEGLLRVVRR